MPVVEKVAAAEAVERITEALDDLASEVKENFGQASVTCTPDDLVEVLVKLRDTEGIECRFFTFMSGVDRSEFGSAGPSDDSEGEADASTAAGPRLEVLIHLYSPTTTIHATIHIPVTGAEPSCPTITGVFRGAYWHERETHEMFGIDFEGHPALINLYLPEDFEGHPLLKSFRLPGRVLKPWPGAKDAEEGASGGRA